MLKIYRYKLISCSVSFWRKPESAFKHIPRCKMDSGFRQNDTEKGIVIVYFLGQYVKMYYAI